MFKHTIVTVKKWYNNFKVALKMYEVLVYIYI